MKIFLVYIVIDSPQNNGYQCGVGYIAAVLKQEGHDVRYFHLQSMTDVGSLYERVLSEEPGLIGFSVTSSQFCYLRDIVRNMPKRTRPLLIAGGTHPTLCPDCLSEVPELDGIVRGEGEYPMAELARAMEAGRDYTGIKSFWFKKGGAIVKNEMRPIIQDLDQLPFPDKSVLDYQKLLDQFGGRNRFIFSRGCPLHCTYCSNKVLSDLYGHGYVRHRSPQKAIEEIRRDVERYTFKLVTIDDDMVTINKKWFYEFFTLYPKEFTLPFDCNIRPGMVDEDMVVTLKKAGCAYAYIGVEQGNDAFRRRVLNRHMTNEQIIHTFELFKKHGIQPFAHVMVGLPYETKELFWDTVRLFRRLGIRSNDISIFTPYPGTELWELCQTNGWMPDRTGFRERHEAVVSYPAFTKREIQQCHDLFPILLRHRFLPAWLMRTQNVWAPPALQISRLSKAVRRWSSGRRPLPAEH